MSVFDLDLILERSAANADQRKPRLEFARAVEDIGVRGDEAHA